MMQKNEKMNFIFHDQAVLVLFFFVLNLVLIRICVDCLVVVRLVEVFDPTRI